MKIFYILMPILIFVLSSIGLGHKKNEIVNSSENNDTIFLNKEKNHFYIIIHHENDTLIYRNFFFNKKKYKYEITDLSYKKLEVGFVDSSEINSLNYKMEFYKNGMIKEKDCYFGHAVYEVAIQDTIINLEGLDGFYTSYYENGVKQIERTYINGMLNGEYKEYFENGKLKLFGLYYNNKKKGIFISYDSTGVETKKDTIFKLQIK